MILSSKILLAIKVAVKAHENQKRFIGANDIVYPYIVHPIRVSEIVRMILYSCALSDISSDIGIIPIRDEIICASILHDVPEDTDVKLIDLENLFGTVISSLVNEVTSDSIGLKKMGKAKYLIDKINNMSYPALIIKLSDRLDNVSDLIDKSNEFSDRYYKESVEIVQNIKTKCDEKESIVFLKNAIIEVLKKYRSHREGQDISL